MPHQVSSYETRGPRYEYSTCFCNFHLSLLCATFDMAGRLFGFEGTPVKWYLTISERYETSQSLIQQRTRDLAPAGPFAIFSEKNILLQRIFDLDEIDYF